MDRSLARAICVMRAYSSSVSTTLTRRGRLRVRLPAARFNCCTLRHSAAQGYSYPISESGVKGKIESANYLLKLDVLVAAPPIAWAKCLP
jgi:hypothetical protein